MKVLSFVDNLVVFMLKALGGNKLYAANLHPPVKMYTVAIFNIKVARNLTVFFLITI